MSSASAPFSRRRSAAARLSSLIAGKESRSCVTRAAFPPWESWATKRFSKPCRTRPRSSIVSTAILPTGCWDSGAFQVLLTEVAAQEQSKAPAAHRKNGRSFMVFFNRLRALFNAFHLRNEARGVEGIDGIGRGEGAGADGGFAIGCSGWGAKAGGRSPGGGVTMTSGG